MYVATLCLLAIPRGLVTARYYKEILTNQFNSLANSPITWLSFVLATFLNRSTTPSRNSSVPRTNKMSTATKSPLVTSHGTSSKASLNLRTLFLMTVSEPRACGWGFGADQEKWGGRSMVSAEHWSFFLRPWTAHPDKAVSSTHKPRKPLPGSSSRIWFVGQIGLALDNSKRTHEV